MKSNFRSAIERQIAEAVSIDFEKKKGKIIMNSKSQYNRCTLPRISFGNHIDTEEELETEEELMVKNEIKKMRKSKRERKKNEKTCRRRSKETRPKKSLHRGEKWY